MKPFYPVFICSVWFLNACTTPQQAPNPLDGRWIDLTYEFSDETIYWPTSDLFSIDTVSVGRTEAGFYYESYKIATAEHGGTHLDAPVHFAEGKQSTEEIPIERLVGPASVINVSEKALEDRDYLVSVEDLEAWEAVHGELEEGTIVLLKTGYGQFWPDPVQYMGTAVRGAEGVAELHFPGLAPEAARWLVEERSIDAIGIDTPSIDYGQSTLFESHQILFEDNIPAFENVANLNELPPTGAYVFALPMKVKNGSGGPLRIVAVVE